MHRQEATIESQKTEIKSLRRELESTHGTPNNWDEVNLNLIQGVYDGDSIDTSLCGAVFDTVIMPTEHGVVRSMREHTRLYNEGVQAAGKGHTLGPPQILGMERD